MTDTTTIEIRDDQQEALRDLKQHDRESYKSVLDRLLDGDTVETDNGRKRELLKEIHAELDRLEERLNGNTGTGPVQLDATEYSKIADEIEGRLR